MIFVVANAARTRMLEKDEMKLSARLCAAMTLFAVTCASTLLIAAPAQAVSGVAWSDTSITNGESTALVYTMGGTFSYAAQWYDNVYVGCFWKSSASQNLPITYEAARTTTSQATTWWIGLYETDCRSVEPLKTDAYSWSELTLTPAGPYGPDTVTAIETTETSITLSWAADSYATGYYVYRDGELIATLGARDVQYLVSGLTAGTSYSFEVVGFNDDFGGEGSTVSLSTTDSALPGDGGESDNSSAESGLPDTGTSLKIVGITLGSTLMLFLAGLFVFRGRRSLGLLAVNTKVSARMAELDAMLTRMEKSARSNRKRRHD